MLAQGGLLFPNSLRNYYVCVSLLPVAILCYLIYVRYATPLRSVPGPFLASFTRLWKLQKTLRGDFERTNIDLHNRYGEMRPTTTRTYLLTRLVGPIVRIGPNEVSIDDPEESLRVIYGHGTKFVKVRPKYLYQSPYG